MSKKRTIAVIGMGQGGMVAAIKLAEAGFQVDVYEKAEENAVSYPWWDDIRYDVFELVGIPMPEEKDYRQKSKWLFVSPDEKSSLAVPPLPPMEEISISRRGLNQHLCKLAKEAGCKLHFGTPVEELVVKDDVVVGFKAGKKTVKADLVIDASGLHSPFRKMVPEKFGIQDQPGTADVLNGYRAFFERVPGTARPDPESTLYVMHLYGCGISWCNLNEEDQVDILIGRFGGLTEEDRAACEADLRKNHDMVSDKVIHPGRWVDVCARCTIARMVADGYALVGDSAFMTMPFMGSGIEASMKAGKILAETVIKNKKKKFTAKNLWGYQVEYYNKLGAVYTLIDIAKRWALGVDPALIDWLFGCGVVTSEDMKLLSTDSENQASLSVLDILKKVAILFRRPKLIGEAVAAVARAAKGLLVAKQIPKKYNEKKVREWQEKYEGLLK